MFNLSHTFIICSSLFQLLPSVTLSQGGVVIALCERIEHPYIKECALPISPPELSAKMSRLAPFSLFAVLCGLVKLITCRDISGHWVDMWRSATFTEKR